MPKETKEQKGTVARVMHEFKHGELESGAGKQVKSRRQAAGTSNQESPEKNRENLKQTKKKEREARAAKQEKEGRL
jgi:hypothetical protein